MNLHQNVLRPIRISALLLAGVAVSSGQTIWDVASTYNGYGAWAAEKAAEMKGIVDSRENQGGPAAPAPPVAQSVPGFSITYPETWAVDPITPGQNTIAAHVDGRTRVTKKGERWADIEVAAGLLIWNDPQTGVGMATDTMIAEFKKEYPGTTETRQTIVNLPFGQGIQTDLVHPTEFKYDEFVAMLTFETRGGLFKVMVSAPRTEYGALLPVIKDIVNSISINGPVNSISHKP